MAPEADVRQIALPLPETEERPSYGTPGFRVKDRLFARIREPGVLLVRLSDEGEKDFLLRAEPEKFFTTPHYDGHPSVLVHLAAVDREELAELLADAWRARAPKRLADALDPWGPARSAGHAVDEVGRPAEHLVAVGLVEDLVARAGMDDLLQVREPEPPHP